MRRNVWLEINASPERLDLTAPLVRAAKARGREVHHLDRRASSQASGQHALRRHHGAARMARGRRHSEYAAAGRSSRRRSKPNETNLFHRSHTDTYFSRDRGPRASIPDGFEIKRAIVQHGGSAVMMPIDDARRILLVRQYRLPARQLPVGTAGRHAWTKAKRRCRPPSAS